MDEKVKALVLEFQEIVRKQTKSKYPDVTNAVRSLQDYVKKTTASKSGVEDKLTDLVDMLSKKSEKMKLFNDHIEKIRKAMRSQRKASAGATKSKEDKRKPSSPATSARATPIPSKTKENTKLRKPSSPATSARATPIPSKTKENTKLRKPSSPATSARATPIPSKTKENTKLRKPPRPATSERATPKPCEIKKNTKLRFELIQPEETTELSGRIDQDEEQYVIIAFSFYTLWELLQDLVSVQSINILDWKMADEVRYFVECINGLKEVFIDDTKIALEKIIPVPNGKIKKKVETGYTYVMDVARDISRLKTENQYLRKTLDGLHKYIIGGDETALKELKTPKQLLKDNQSIVEVEANVKELTQKFHKTKTELSASKQEMANKIKEYEHKLSQLASAKLTHDNHAIPDLSDPDRPTQLAETYSSLYDNQWTDALAELKKLYPKASEKVLTEQLLNILTDGFNFCKDARQDQVTKLEQLILDPAQSTKSSQDGFNFCKDARQDQVTKLEQLILDPAQSTKSSQGNYNQVNEIFTKHLRDAAKASSIVASESIFKAFVSNTKMNKKYGNLMNLCGAYIEDCVRLCWLMQVQSPPVCIDLGIKEGQTFLKNTYREYTSSGKKIAFVVWPALFLHEKGLLLMKGVAQAK